MLSHYDAVIWETGNDLVTRTAGRAGGNADRLALDEMLEFRSYMNEGGKVLLAGDSAGQQYTRPPSATSSTTPRARSPATRFPPARTRGAACPCSARSAVATPPTTCCSTTWAATSPWPTTVTTDGAAFDSVGVDDPFTGLAWGLDDPVFAGNTIRRSSFLATSGILPPDQFKQFESWPAARYDKPGGPFDPHTGDQYVYSQIADVSYKRLTREIAVPASRRVDDLLDVVRHRSRTGTTCSWRRARPAVTTGRRCRTPTGTPRRRPARAARPGWVELHPQLAHYQTWDGRRPARATGTHRRLERRERQLGGWQQWSIDLSAYAGEDRRDLHRLRQRLGARRASASSSTTSRSPTAPARSFETGLDGWAITGPPAGSAPNANNFIRTDASGFPVGNAIATPHSLLLGFGLEGVSTAAERNAVMGRALDHLLD